MSGECSATRNVVPFNVVTTSAVCPSSTYYVTQKMESGEHKMTANLNQNTNNLDKKETTETVVLIPSPSGSY